MKRSLVVTVMAFVTLFGCKGSSASSEADAGATGTSAARVGSCDRGSTVGTCSEYDGAYLAQNENLVKSSCTKLGGSFVNAECPNTSTVGVCKMSSGESRKFYSTGANAYDADRARKECETAYHGKWAAQ